LLRFGPPVLRWAGQRAGDYVIAPPLAGCCVVALLLGSGVPVDVTSAGPDLAVAVLAATAAAPLRQLVRIIVDLPLALS